MERIISTAEAALNFQGIFAGDQVFQPDDTKAYAECYLSHAWPTVLPFYRHALHPAVVFNGHRTLRDQQVNLSHQIRSYDKENINRDRVIGHVAWVELATGRPDDGTTGLREGGTKTEDGLKFRNDGPAVGIRAILALAKQAEGVDRVLGGKLTGRRAWSVSVEYLYDIHQSGFLVSQKELEAGAAGELLPAQKTPEDIRAAGYYYVEYDAAPEKLRACWSPKQRKITGQWRGANPILLTGGLEGPIHYMGVALTENPAEPTARIAQVLAEDGDMGLAEYEKLLAGVKKAAEITRTVLTESRKG